MNDGEMSEAEFVQFIKGWNAAKYGTGFDTLAEDAWKAGFAFWLQVKTEEGVQNVTRH